MNLASLPIPPGPGKSPKHGAFPIRAFFFDTYGTVCDFYRPFCRVFEKLARDKGVEWNSAELAIEWRNAYVRVTFLSALTGASFRPLKDIQRENLATLLAGRLPAPLADEEIAELATAWDRLDPWPDTVAGLTALKETAIVAPLSNGNFDDMVRLARHARLPWDLIVGSSLARAYKPRPDIYLQSVAALGLEPREVCMVAAHQADLAYAAGHGMQTAFVIRRDEFGGATKPEHPEAGIDYLDAAEIFPEGDWTYVANDFIDLAAQSLRA